MTSLASYFCVHSEEDEEKEYRDIFGSSEDSEGEEEVKETQPKPLLRRASISGDEEQASEIKTKETKLSREQKKLSDIEEDILRTSVLESGVLKAEHLMTENENLSQIQLYSKPVKPKPAPPRPQFKRRLASVEDEILQRITQRGPDKEDVQMFKLAIGKMKDEKNEMAGGVSWAYYPHNILCRKLKEKKKCPSSKTRPRDLVVSVLHGKFHGNAINVCVYGTCTRLADYVLRFTEAVKST